MDDTSTRPFYIPDTTPFLSWSPCVNCDGTGGAGWRSGYSPSGNGHDQTFHHTSSGNASLSFSIAFPLVVSWVVWSYPFHDTTSGNASLSFSIAASRLLFDLGYDGPDCPAVFSLNGSEVGPACGQPSALLNMPLGIHQITLRSTLNGTSLRVNGVSGDYPSLGKAKFSNITIDNTHASMVYSPSDNWKFLDSSSTTDQVAGSRMGNGMALGGFYNSSVALASFPGAGMNFTFQAEAVFLYGMSGPSGGTADLLLDGVKLQSLNTSNPWDAYSSLLFFTHGLTPSDTHTVELISTSGGQIAIDYALLTRPISTSPSNRLPVILGAVSAGVVALLLLLVGGYYYTTRRASPSRAAKYGFATGISSKSFPSQASSIETWRKDPTVNLTATGRISPIVQWSDGPEMSQGTKDIPRLGNRGSGAHAQPVKSELEYADYIPYRGPIEPPPAAISGNSDEHNLPYLEGATPATTRWFEIYDYVGHPASATASPESEKNGSTPRNIPRKPSPPRLQASAKETPNTSPWGGAQASKGLANEPSRGSPWPLSSHSSSTASTAQIDIPRSAQPATRSVARLWPSRAAVPSNYLLSSLDPGSSGLGGLSGRPDLLVNTHLSPGHPFAPTSSPQTGHRDSQALTPPESGACALRLPFLTTPPPKTSFATHLSPGGGSLPPLSPLRRGVSVKSIKTSRSFLSGLLSSPIPYTATLPQTAARPDSGIFPRSLSRAGSNASRNGNSARGPHPTGSSAGHGRPFGGAGSAGSVKREATETSPNFFIELNPNSPMTEFSRPENR